MRTTPYKGYALYEPDASPDLTETGEYNTALMAVDADMHDEEQARIEGDTALNIAIANEMAQRKAADAALGKRIDNAEVEISANSADLTGIKGLTYGEQHVNFIENSNGEYSSPALEEIAEQISQGFTVLEITSTATSIGADALARLQASWPKTIVRITIEHSANTDEVMLPIAYLNGLYTFMAPLISDNRSDHSQYMPSLAITGTGEGKVDRKPFTVPYPYWPHVKNKPFSTIGTGLKVVDDTLTVDTQALPSALTVMQLSEFGELTDNTSSTHSAIGDGNAAAYAKLKQAWPSVIVVEGGTSWKCGMYTPANAEQSGYILVKSADTTNSAIQMRIHGGGFSGAITLEEIGG